MNEIIYDTIKIGLAVIIASMLLLLSNVTVPDAIGMVKI